MKNENQVVLKFLFKEQFFTLKQLEANEAFAKLKEPVMVYSDNVPYKNVVHVFEDDVMMKKWASFTKIGAIVEEVLAKTEEAKKEEFKNHKYAQKKINQKAERIRQELKSLSKRTDLPFHSKELHRLATVDAPIIEGHVFDPAFLFTEINYRGNFFPMWHGLWLPNFNWIGMNDQISSGHVIGLLVLCEHSWWRGRKLWLSGADLEFINLNWFGFNDRTSSAIHF